jgi:hypothetical protein
VDFQAFLDWLINNRTLVLALLTAAGAVAHAFGYNVPLLSWLIVLLQKLPALAPANGKPKNGTLVPAVPAVPTVPHVVGGPAGIDPTFMKQHPLFDMLRNQLAGQHNLPAAHPLIERAALLALVSSPALLAMFPLTAPFAPVAAVLAALLHSPAAPALPPEAV